MIPDMASAGQQPDSLNIQLLVDSIPALIHTARADGHLDYFNKPWLDYLGATLDDVAGWKWTAFIHPEDVDGIVARWRACLATGEIFEYETRVRRANGDYRWMFHRKVPVRDGNRNIVKWYGSSMDIDERKTGEEQLRRNAEELQTSEFYLAEGQRLAHLGSWAFDSGGFYYWSPELFRLHGLDPASKPPSVQEYLDRVHPHDRESMADLIKGIFAKASTFDVTKRIVRPNGEVRYIRCVGAPVVENQSLKKYVGSAMDVTENELLAQELRRREAYLTKAQRLSHTGSFGWKPDTGEIVWSDETYRIFEYDPAEKPTVSMLLQRTHPRDRALVQQVIENVSESGTDFEHEYRLLLPDGRVKHVHAIAHALQDASGNREFVGAVTDITERKTAEEALRSSEAYLAEAQRLSHTGSWAWSPDTDVRYWSEECYRVLGFDPRDGSPRMEELIQRIHPDDQAAFRESAERANHSKLDEEVDYRIVHPGGAVRNIHSIGHPVFSASGDLVQYTGTVIDVTECKRAEEELRRSEMELKNALDEIKKSEADLLEAQRLSHMGSWRHDVLTGIVKISPEVHRIFDVRPGEDASTAGFFFGRIHPEDRPIEAQKYERAYAAKTDFESDYRIVLPDGSIKHVHNVGRPVLHESGEITEFVGTVIDITERKRAEEERRRSEIELRQMLDLVPQLVAVFGPEHERIYANRMGLDYLGVSLEEWRQTRDMRLFVHPDDGDRVRALFGHALSLGAPYQVEYRIRKDDGSYRWFLARYNPLRDELGRIARWYVAFTDIEDRKRAEERLQRENVALREEIDKASMFEEIVGTSPALKSVLSHISKVAPSDSTVLITGETGTGKELVARAIHRRSKRASRVFVSVNCAAIPRDLIASELFGHEKGAFTGATQQRLGRFELANGGTIFLDEVGELPAETQIALLRVLQEHEFERVGGTRRIHADVRVIAATNRDLQAAISAGAFRNDLFYRLNVFPLKVPPLRERKEDIPLLVNYFIDRYARKAGKNITGVDKKTLRLLESYRWPGNIRELQNVIERSVILCETEIFSIDESWLSQPLPGEPKSQTELSEKLVAQEKKMIEAALKESLGRVFGPSGAAARLGMPRSTLESKIRALKINKNRFKASAGEAE
jgi:PAS domain S-box-containing protein